MKVRYALPTGSEPVAEAHYPAPAALFDGLSDTPSALVEVRSKPSKSADASKWVFGAVCPVWVTVAVPTDASAGDYTGTLTIAKIIVGHSFLLLVILIFSSLFYNFILT